MSLLDPRATASVLEYVRSERGGQDNRWGQKDHSPSRWCAILVEGVGKAAQQANKLEWCAADPAELRAKVISAAAVAVAWVEAIDRAAANSRDTGTAGGG